MAGGDGQRLGVTWDYCNAGLMRLCLLLFSVQKESLAAFLCIIIACG